MDFLTKEVEITEEQATVFARGMLSVGRVDGAVDPRELALIQEFYPGDPATLDRLDGLDPAELTMLGEGPVARLFLRSCILVAIADQDYADSERSLIASYAAGLHITDEERIDLEQSVKEFLIKPLSRLSNTDAVVEVAKKLDV